MEEINLKELFSYLLQKIWIIITIAAVVIFGGEIYTNLLKTPKYRSTSNVVLISEQNKELTYNDVTLSNNLVKTYSEIVTSRNILEKVIQNLNLNESYESLRKDVTVETTTSTQLIAISVVNPDAEQAKNITNEIASVFKKEIKSIYGIDNVQVVDRAVTVNTPYNIDVLKETIIYIIAGLMLGIGVAMLLFVTDKTIKDTETVENKVGLTVIGVVPDVEKR